jgi:hypothetical protein
MKKEWLYAIVAMTGSILGGLAGGKLSAAASATTPAQTAAPVVQVSKTIAAQEILLVDAKGNTRGALRLDKNGDPSFALYDHNAKLRADVQISDEEGAGLKFFGPTGTPRILLTINIDGIPALRLLDAQAHPRALFGVDPDGEPALDFYTQEGRLLRELP